MKNTSQIGTFIRRARESATKLIEAKEELDALLAQRTSENADYAALTDEHFLGEDAGLRLPLLDLWTVVSTLDAALPSSVMAVFYAVRK